MDRASDKKARIEQLKAQLQACEVSCQASVELSARSDTGLAEAGSAIDYLSASVDEMEPVLPSVKDEDHQRVMPDEDVLASRLKNDRSTATADDVFNRIVRLLSFGDRPVKVLRERLIREGYPSHCIDDGINRACRSGFLDDARYAEQAVYSAIAQGKGLPGLMRELQYSGIELEDLAFWQENAVSWLDGEYERALSYAKHHPSSSKNPQQALYRKLVSRGYSSVIASQVARELSSQ